jgi:hypothetical protein
MSALLNFQELVRQEAIEFQLEQKIERFEWERSDIIMQNLRSSMDFLKFIGDISNLFFPVFLDTVLGVSSDISDEDLFPDIDEEPQDQPIDDGPDSPDTPDQGAVTPRRNQPPDDGPGGLD